MSSGCPGILSVEIAELVSTKGPTSAKEYPHMLIDKSTGHQYSQCWLNIHCIGPVSYGNIIFIGSNNRKYIYCKTSIIRCTIVGNKIVDHSDVCIVVGRPKHEVTCASRQWRVSCQKHQNVGGAILFALAKWHQDLCPVTSVLATYVITACQAVKCPRSAQKCEAFDSTGHRIMA